MLRLIIFIIHIAQYGTVQWLPDLQNIKYLVNFKVAPGAAVYLVVSCRRRNSSHSVRANISPILKNTSYYNYQIGSFIQIGQRDSLLTKSRTVLEYKYKLYLYIYLVLSLCISEKLNISAKTNTCKSPLLSPHKC